LQALPSTGIGRLAGYDGTLASQWYFALFSAPNAVNDVDGNVWADPAWSFTGAYGTNTTRAGRFFASEPNASGGVTIPGMAAGSYAALNVIAWNASVGGTSLAEFISAWNSGTPGLGYGNSAVAHIFLGNGFEIPDIFIFGVTAGQITGFVVGIPEPTTFALAVLCVATVLTFRRVHRVQYPAGYDRGRAFRLE
jgi:hypothetical protein